MFRFFSVLIGYALGCVQVASIVVHRRTGGNIHEMGTKNPGTCNVANELGHRAGFLTLFGDLGKTIVAIIISRLLFSSAPWELCTLYAGLGAVVGHCLPVQNGFKGGKGVACVLATMLMLGWQHLALALCAEVVTPLVTRLMVAGALGAATTLPLGLILFRFSGEAIAVGIVTWGFIMGRHAENFKKIARGEEVPFSTERFFSVFRKRKDPPEGNE
jgi:glycerol-3-phosphate acyltransferase PlsY